MESNMGSTHAAPGQSRQLLTDRPAIDYFANALDDCIDDRGTKAEKRSRILKLVDQYHSYASERYSRLKTRTDVLSASYDGSSASTEARDLALEASREAESWKQEAQVWNLLQHILPVRYPAVDVTPSGPPFASSTRPTLWHSFVNGNPLAMERMSVLRWLHTISSEGPSIDEVVEDLHVNADRGDIIAHGWIHTRSTIKLRKSVLAWPHVLDPSVKDISQSHVNSLKSPLITQLDPDSSTRQQRSLEPQDEFFERAIWRGCFELLRRGCTASKVESWCRERTEGWRAVSLTALDMNDIETTANPDRPAESFALWMRACLAVSQKGALGDYERAVYGLLSGEVSSVERVSTTWEDFVFAHYNSLFRGQFDSFILARCASDIAATLSRRSLPLWETIQHYDESTCPEKRFLRSLESKSIISTAARSPIKVLLASILSKDLESHFFDQGFALGFDGNRNKESRLLISHDLAELDVDTSRFYTLDNHHGLRIVSHLYIILSRIGNLYERPHDVISANVSRGDVQQNVIASYASLLRLSGLYELLPLYCSTMSPSRQYEVLCRNLIHVVDPKSRELVIDLIGKAGLDCLKFVKTQAMLQSNVLLTADNTHTKRPPFHIVESVDRNLKYGRPVRADFFGEDPDSVDSTHEFLIRGVEWLLTVENAWPDALSYGSKLYKFFLSMPFHLSMMI